MRKPLVAMGLAVGTSLLAIPAANVLAAVPASSKPTLPPVSSAPLPSQAATATTFSSKTSITANTVSGASIIQTALKYIGYPYTATGNSPSTGFSCIGFVSFVYRSNGIPLPGDLEDALAYAPQVPFSDLQPGDILYFQNTVWNGLSHAAIYLGGGKFIHSEYFGVGVRISSFNGDPRDYNYWSQHYLGANRPWGGAAVAPVVVAPPIKNAPVPGSGVSATSTNVSQILSGPSATVSVSALNVRTSPSKNGGIAQVVGRGTTVTVVGKKGGWYKVQLSDGTVGWVVAAGLGKASASASANPNIGQVSAPTRAGAPSASVRTPSVTARSRASGLRVHSAPSLGASVVTTISKNERVTVIGRSGSWVHVRTGSGATGWVAAGYVSTRATAPRSTYTAPSYKSYSYTAPRRTTHRATRTVSRGPVLTAGVRVHSAPGIKSRVVGLAARGTHVTVLGYRNGWALVRLPNGTVGYVAGAYVR